MTRSIMLIIDITIVVVVSILSFVLEQFITDLGWVVIGPQARGLTAILGGTIAAIAVVLARGGSFADLGFKRPRNWAKVPVQVVTILVAFISAQALVPVLVSQLFTVPSPDLSNYDALSGDLAAAIGLVLLMPITASIPEEIIYRGFLMGRLSDIFGCHRSGAWKTVTVQAMFFSSVHFINWGIGGVIVTFIMGVIWGSAYLLCDRNLWVVIIAHSSVHILFAIQIYSGVSIVI